MFLCSPLFFMENWPTISHTRKLPCLATYYSLGWAHDPISLSLISPLLLSSDAGCLLSFFQDLSLRVPRSSWLPIISRRFLPFVLFSSLSPLEPGLVHHLPRPMAICFVSFFLFFFLQNFFILLYVLSPLPILPLSSTFPCLTDLEV